MPSEPIDDEVVAGGPDPAVPVGGGGRSPHLSIDAIPEEHGGLAWLRSQGLGLACGLATAVLLAIGSVVITATRDGASAHVAMDDVRVFFREPSPWHVWFYLLGPVLGLYALNTVLCTWHNVTRRWRQGQRAPAAYAAAVMHVAFLIALVAHAAGGLGGHDGAPVMLGQEWAPLDPGRQARVTGLTPETYPDGQLLQMNVDLEVREAGGESHVERVRFNQPLSRGLGRDLFLLVDAGHVVQARIAVGGERCVVGEGDGCLLAGHRVQVAALQPGMAEVRVLGSRGGESFMLLAGGARALADGQTLALEAVLSEDAALLRPRHAPGNPWALGAAVVLGLGVLMLGRRWL